MTREEIYTAINFERDRQAAQWNVEHNWGFGDCSSNRVSDSVKAVVLAEECGEVSRAVLDLNGAKLQRELIQVAAVAVAWLEAIEV